MGWLRSHGTVWAPLVVLSTVLVWASDGSVHSGVWLTASLASGVWFLIVAWRTRDSEVPVSVLVGIALILRLSALTLPLTLSEDVYRYLWDGRLAVAGVNPYEVAPEDTGLVELRDELWQRVEHREVETVYPPVAIAAFSIASVTDHPVVAWKLIVTLADLASCVVLWLLARRLGLASGRTIGYLWNPLVVVELSGMGHVDGLGILGLLAAALWLSGSATGTSGSATRTSGSATGTSGSATGPRRAGERTIFAAIALAGAVLTKLIPALVVAPWTRSSRRPALFAGATLLVVATALVPVGIASGGIPPGLTTYGVSWEFNGPIFEPAWRLVEVARIDDLAKWALSGVTAVTGVDRLSSLSRWMYPQLITKFFLGLGLLAAVAAVARRADDLVSSAYLVFAAFVTTSATVHPWYVLWVVPWAVLGGRRSWLVLTVSVQLAYLPRFFAIPYFPWVYLAVWSPFVLSFLIERALQTDTVLPR